MIQKIKAIYKRYKNCKKYILKGEPFAKILIHNASMWQEGEHFIVYTSHEDICNYHIESIRLGANNCIHMNAPLPSGVSIGGDYD